MPEGVLKKNDHYCILTLTWSLIRSICHSYCHCITRSQCRGHRHRHHELYLLVTAEDSDRGGLEDEAIRGGEGGCAWWWSGEWAPPPPPEVETELSGECPLGS